MPRKPLVRWLFDILSPRRDTLTLEETLDATYTTNKLRGMPLTELCSLLGVSSYDEFMKSKVLATIASRWIKANPEQPATEESK